MSFQIRKLVVCSANFGGPVGSEWAVPIVVVKKKDGNIRICVDYRRLNSVSAVDAYSMPRADDHELIDQLGKAKYITTLWPVVIGRCQCQTRTKGKLHLLLQRGFISLT